MIRPIVVKPYRIAAPILLIGLAMAPAAEAQPDRDTVIEERRRTRPYQKERFLAARAFFGAIGEDFFLSMRLKLNYEQKGWGLGLQLPLRLRLSDEEPKADKDILGIIRGEDWDEPSDAFRFLRYLYVGEPDGSGPYYVLAGELGWLDIGYGTLMHGYHNGMDVSRWRAGVRARVDVDGFSAEGMLGDIAAPYLNGLRVAVRPFELSRGFAHEWYDRFEIGASFIADWRAPFALARESDPSQLGPGGTNACFGVLPTDEAQYRSCTRVRVEDELPLVAESRFFGAFGLDFGLELTANEYFKITPYTAINKTNVVDKGWGWHTGVLWSVYIPRGLEAPFEATLRTEYRLVSGDYLGQYFNGAYEIERYQRLATRTGGNQPKLRALCRNAECTDEPLGARNSVFLAANVGLPGIFLFGTEYSAYDGDRPDGSFRLFVEVPYFEYVQAKVFYNRFNISNLGDAFALDDRSSIIAEARIPLFYAFALNLSWLRQWEAPVDGGFESVDTWNVGFGVFIPL